MEKTDQEIRQKVSDLDIEKALPLDSPPSPSVRGISDEERSSSQASEEDIEDDGSQPLSRTPTNQTAKEGAISRTLSLVRTKDSGRDPGPPPDGGFNAWFQAWLAHLVVFNTWGYVNGFGVFQTYYTEMLDRAPSDISWIGSIQVFLLFFIGTFSGRATDAGYFKAVWTVGALTIIFGIFMTSLCTTYWQIFLAQGICMGVGSGLVFCPTLTLMSTYFNSKRAFALAITASGSATGALVFPVVLQQLLPRIGFAWTVRVLGLITVVTLAPGFVFLRQRLPPRRSGPFFEWAAFKEPSYTLYAIGMFLNFWALYVAFFYVSSFGRTVIGISQEDSIDLILIMNGVGVFGRLIPNIMSDWKFGPINCIIPFTTTSAVILFGWIGVKDMPGLYVFAVVYGFFAAGVQSLFPAALTSLTTDLKKTGIRFGMVMSIVSFASLTGSPIAGALIRIGDGNYLYAQIFCALSMTIGSFVLVAARYWVVGPRLMVRV